jgi:hypothetical protein
MEISTFADWVWYPAEDASTVYKPPLPDGAVKRIGSVPVPYCPSTGAAAGRARE